MWQSPSWEAKRSSASQEIPCILYYPEILYCIPSTSWRFTLILSSHKCLGFQSGLLPSGFPTKALYAPLFFPFRATCPTPLILHYLMTWIISGDKHRSRSSSLCSLLHSPVTLSLLGPNMFLSTLLSSSLSLCSSLNDGDQVSHPHKTKGKIKFMYILNFVFLDSKLEDRRFCSKWWQAQCTLYTKSDRAIVH